MTLLALDLATKTGWAVSMQAHGEWNLKAKAGARLAALRQHLDSVRELHDITDIVAESPFIYPGRASGTMVAPALHAVLSLYCYDYNIRLSTVAPKTIKKYATGTGNATKQMMIEAAQKKYGYKGTSDNTADALHLLFLTKERS